MSAEIKDEFKIDKFERDGKTFLRFTPTVDCGYPAKEVEITNETWLALRYHFGTKVYDTDPNKRVGLAYVV